MKPGIPPTCQCGTCRTTAPELYDALEALLDDAEAYLEDAAMHLGSTSTTCQAARSALLKANPARETAALAKARGEQTDGQ